ncbi:MAG TPA: sigma-70 family RNA polymerase sigma factor [Myxococcales bacterium]|nr:sigma-70 family RNA polymerase sigma factor [Myxococcales bacterium]
MAEDRLPELYRRYGPVIYQRCRRLLRDPALAEDATQETFLRIHQNLARVPGDADALRWIYRVATNYCLNELRNQRHRPQVADDDAPPEIAGEDIERLLLDAHAIRRLLGSLPEKLAAVAALHYLEGLDQGEVAEVLGVSRRTVVYRLTEFQARARELVQTARPTEAA